MSKRNAGSCCCCVLITLLVVVALLGFVILMPNSVQYAEYYEYALLKQRSTGLVERGEVYSNVRMFRGPDYTMETYKSTSHHVRLDRLHVATIDRVGIEVSVSFQYFLRKEDIVRLHDEYGEDYEEVIIERSTDALKAKAPSFTVREYIDNRTDIEHEFFSTIRRRVEGVCCHNTCKKRGTCLPDCKSTGCTTAEHGVLVEVRYFQLLGVFIDKTIAERYRKALILQELAEKAELEQQASVIRKETESLAEVINRETYQINQAAVVEYNTIVRIGAANKTAILDSTHRNGLLYVYNVLGIKEEEHRNTFDYLRVLRADKSVHLTVDFQQRTIGSWTKK